ncbi:MAG TPA: serine/threonine protein phosphatase [Clostridiaceae bacterium]|nr:serine/threonine protein phosphatase [Clostridiaceae bacterium]
MRVFAIGDLHLSTLVDKPMDVFGTRWNNHAEKIQENWLKTVESDDLVIVAGDISWATDLAEALPDLRLIDDLPGKKILLRGNHDYWWQSITKLRRLGSSEGLNTISFLQNDAFLLEDGTVICGTRGWLLPGDADYSVEADEKIMKRELIRLKISLQEAEKLRNQGKPLIAALHYPPFVQVGDKNEVTALLEEFGVTDCVYGHIHHVWTKLRLNRQEIRGIRYSLVACDQIGFTPKLIFP